MAAIDAYKEMPVPHDTIVVVHSTPSTHCRDPHDTAVVIHTALLASPTRHLIVIHTKGCPGVVYALHVDQLQDGHTLLRQCGCMEICARPSRTTSELSSPSSRQAKMP